MRYSLIRKMDITNGEGLGVALFVQGCHFHCKGCFNPETWDFSGGKEWNNVVEQKFFELVNKPYITRITILGGEPLCNENVEKVKDIICKLRKKYPHKKIWVYTGYNYENIMFGNKKLDRFSRLRKKTICMVDVLVDGQFELSKQDLFNDYIVFAGSTNQRVIDIKKSLLTGKIEIYNSEEY